VVMQHVSLVWLKRQKSAMSSGPLWLGKDFALFSSAYNDNIISELHLTC